MLEIVVSMSQSRTRLLFCSFHHVASPKIVWFAVAMTSKIQRLEATQKLLLKADVKSDLFPGLIFSDAVWKVILRLYIAPCEGLTVTGSLAIS
jgi:hypothetical protein